jgi:hypothetical protein
MSPFDCISAKIAATALDALVPLPTNRAPPALTWPDPTHRVRPLAGSIGRALKSVWRLYRKVGDATPLLTPPNVTPPKPFSVTAPL